MNYMHASKYCVHCYSVCLPFAVSFTEGLHQASDPSIFLQALIVPMLLHEQADVVLRKCGSLSHKIEFGVWDGMDMMYVDGWVLQALPSTVFYGTNVLQIHHHTSWVLIENLFEVAEIRPSELPPIVVTMTLERTKTLYGPCESLL